MKRSQNLILSGQGRRRLLGLLLAIVLILAVAKTGVALLEDFLVVTRPLPSADALVVMAGSMNERLPVAARLFLEGVAPRILLTNDGIFSAWSAERQRNLYSIEWAEAELMNMRVPQDAIIKLPFSSSGSIFDALHCRKEILSRGIRSIVIVTSDYHTRRSLWIFERVLRDQPVAIGVEPAVSAVSTSPDLPKLLELSREALKLLYYTAVHRNPDLEHPSTARQGLTVRQQGQQASSPPHSSP